MKNQMNYYHLFLVKQGREEGDICTYASRYLDTASVHLTAQLQIDSYEVVHVMPILTTLNNN